MAGRYILLYSETSCEQIKKLHAGLKPLIRSKIEQVREDPYIGKHLQRDLSGYLSVRTRRHRIVYKVLEGEQTIQIHFSGRRKDIYELFSEEIKRHMNGPGNEVEFPDPGREAKAGMSLLPP